MISRNVKPGVFGLGIEPKEVCLAYSTQFVFLTIRLVPGNVVMVAINMCGSGYMELRKNMCILIFPFFLS